MERFKLFMSQLLKTNASLDFYVDFKKCHENVQKIAIKLNQLNYLIGKNDLPRAVRQLWDENPKVFSVLAILIAVRDKDKKMYLDAHGKPHLIESSFDNVENVIDFINQSGLKSVFNNRQITNLVDYVFGVEVGLDSNARKNRSGHIMEDRVAKKFKSAGIQFRKEVNSSEFPVVHKVLGEDAKRFDFVVKSHTKTYLIEVNFYSGGGSKLNEVARAYTELAPKINGCQGYEFVWITDGIGWRNAKGKLEEAFNAIPSIYNLTTLDDFISVLKNGE